jgi:hypothetical protein
VPATETARYHSLLCAGDKLVMTGEARLDANLNGKIKTFVAGDPDLTVPRRPTGMFTERDRGFFERFWPFVTAVRRQIPTYAWARGEDDTPPPTLTPDPLAPTGRQRVLRGTTQVMVLWRGGASNLTVRPELRGSMSVENRRYAWAAVPLAADADRYVVTTENGALSWSIEKVDSAPSPPWFADPNPQTEAERLVRAVWLLTDGPPEWRLFALTELSDLASAGNVVAAQFWQGARSGEIIP